MINGRFYMMYIAKVYFSRLGYLTYMMTLPYTKNNILLNCACYKTNIFVKLKVAELGYAVELELISFLYSLKESVKQKIDKSKNS